MFGSKDNNKQNMYLTYMSEIALKILLFWLETAVEDSCKNMHIVPYQNHFKKAERGNMSTVSM